MDPEVRGEIEQAIDDDLADIIRLSLSPEEHSNVSVERIMGNLEVLLLLLFFVDETTTDQMIFEGFSEIRQIVDRRERDIQKKIQEVSDGTPSSRDEQTRIFK